MKCPHCDRPITRVNIQEMEGNTAPLGRMKWHCVGYACPLCQKIISVQIDPIAIKTDTIAEVKKLLGR